jgi:NhaP-type Na+/H+ or K+/H+ antiporter
MDVALTIVVLGVLVFVAHLFTLLFNRTKIPDVLFLVLIGVCLGPLLGIVTPEKFGVVGPVFTAVTLVIILFEAGLMIRLDVLRRALLRTTLLTILTFIVSTLAVGAITLALTDLSITLSFLLGAIVGSTSPAVIVPLVRQIKMREESQAILYLESAISDALSIIVVFAFLGALKLGELRVHVVAGHVAASFLVSILFGLVFAFAWSLVLHRIRNLKNAIFTTPAFVFVVFGAVELLGYSGYVAALAFGITLGNVELFTVSRLKRFVTLEPISLNETERIFFSEVVFLLKTFFFVYVGLSMQMTSSWFFYVAAMMTFAIFVLRIPIVRLCLHRSTPKLDASLIAVMVPKGLAAAVLASIPLREGIVGGDLIQNVTYAVVLFSIVLTSLLTFLLTGTRLSRVYEWMFRGFGIPQKPVAEAQQAADESSELISTSEDD